MTPYVTMIKLCIVHRFFASFHGAYIRNLANFIAFNFKPLVIPSQLLEEFHNWVKCGQWTLSTHGCHYTTTPVVPPLSMALLPLAFSLPFTKLMPRLAIAPLRATIS